MSENGVFLLSSRLRVFSSSEVRSSAAAVECQPPHSADGAVAFVFRDVQLSLTETTGARELVTWRSATNIQRYLSEIKYILRGGFVITVSGLS